MTSLKAVRQASEEVVTARTVVGIKNLYKYIQPFSKRSRIYKNIYMGISDLYCLCFGKQIWLGNANIWIRRNAEPQNNQHLQGMLQCIHVRREKRMEFSQLGVMDVKTGYNEFRVHKINKYGSKQVRIMVVDAEKALLRCFYGNYKLRRILNLKKLHRIDISKASRKRLCLTFVPGYYSHCELVFKNEAERKSFAHRVIAHSFGESVIFLVILEKAKVK